MKIRKEQFLLPKGKTINTNTPKWTQQNLKTSEFSKSVNNSTCFPSSQPTAVPVETLPASLVTKIKSDMVLSNGDIIVSGQPGGQLFWQQQDGILRQALLSTEKDVKSEEKTVNVESTSMSANAPAVLTITPVPTTQVIKMDDYKVILSSESLPMAWQESGNKTALSTLPAIKPKVDTNPPLLIGKQPVTFATISNVNVLAPNQYPTIMFKDVKNTFATNLVLTSPLVSQNSAPKKAISKSLPKLAKVKKKPITAKKIMLKPASSLLSKIALDRTRQDRIVESQQENPSERTESCISDSSESKVTDVVPSSKCSLLNSAKVETPKTSNQLPTASSKLIIAHGNSFPFSSTLGSKLTEQDVCLTNFTTKNSLENANNLEAIDSHITYEPSSVSVIGHSVEGGGVIMNSDGCIHDEDQDLSRAVLIDSNSTVICADGRTLLDTGVIVENCATGDQSDIIRSEDFHTDHVETILPSDIAHHDEHHTQEYTDTLLSQLQLSSSRVLPNMSSSQVSSVLNALAPSDKSVLNEVNSFTSIKGDKEPVKCEPTEFVKIESLQVPNAIKVMKSKAPEPKYRVCELNKHTCFRCVSCSYLSVRTDSVEKHWATEHRNSHSEQLDRQLTRRQIKCLGCANVVYSKYALQIHLLCDHNVITTEVHELIATTLSANRAPRELRRSSNLKTSSVKTKEALQHTEANEELTGEVSPLAIFHPNIASGPPSTAVSSANCAPSKPSEADDQKLGEEPQIPPTPSFSLFSDIQLPNNDKEETLPPPPPTEDEDSKKLINGKRCARRLRRTARTKLRAEFGCEIKYNFRCMVERCGVRFTTADNLSYHLRCHQPDSDTFCCPECETVTVTWSSLSSHLWRQHGTDIDLYCCKHCGYKCNSYSKLINNHIKIHGEERPFLCDICGKGFKTTKQLRNHKAVHRARRRLLGEEEVGEGESYYACTICSRNFSDARILRHHTENVHKKLRPYHCTFCSHTASSKSSLRMHIRSHTGEKPFSCDECEYVTADHNSLRRHKMRHSGLRPYQCPHCSYNCIQATTYKAHLKNKHPGMDEGLMFSCPMCPFRTVKKDNYLAHKAEHDLGGDPQNRRKKQPLLTNIIQDHSALCKTINQVLPEHETVVLLEDSSDLPSVQIVSGCSPVDSS